VPEESPSTSFEVCLKRLEEIVHDLERADLTLEKSMQLFEEGLRLSGECRRRLDEAEGKLETLVQRNGRVTTAPFELNETPES
jgi:exodeoxyribonuclease VII small subunit